MEQIDALASDVKHIAHTVDSIHEQVKATNGRVNALEDDKIVRDTQLRMIKWFLVTVTGVLTMLVGSWIKSSLNI